MHKKGIIVGGMAGVLVLIGAILAGSNASATVTCGNPNSAGVSTCTDSTTGAITYKSSSSATASVTVSSACSFSTTRAAGYDNEKGYTDTLANNASTEITGSTFTTLCNDAGGYAIYAVGYSNNTLGNTDLIFNNTPSSTNNIHTDGSGSNWGMTMSATVPNKPVIESGFSDSEHSHTIPSTYTKVASYNTVATEISNDEQVGQSVTAHYYAHASSTQPAGTYTGAVKYTMVHPGVGTPAYTDRTIADIVYLQDFDTLSNIELASVKDSMVEEQTYTKKDKRDNQDYTIAKLKDGKVWMTKNLNLAGGTLLSSDTTDFDASYNLPTDRGWQSDGGLPASSASAFDDIDNYGYIYNTGNDTDVCSSPGCYSYYSWDVATVGSGRNITQGNTDASYSVCPKGWRLPKSRTTSATDWRTASDFYGLAHLYGLDSTISTSENDGDFNINAGPGTIPNFLLTGFYNRTGFNVGNSYGDYWSATYNSNPISLILNFDATGVRSANAQYKWLGFAVRCVLRE